MTNPTPNGHQETIMASKAYTEGLSFGSAEALNMLNKGRKGTEALTRTRASQVLNDMVQSGKLTKDGNGSWKRRNPTEGHLCTPWRKRYFEWEGQYTPGYY